MSTVKISLFIPTTPEKAQFFVEQVLSGFSAMSGGASATPVTGAWVMQDGSLCTEPITQVFTLATPDNAGIVRDFSLRIAQEIKSQLAQEAVLFLVEPVSEVQFI